MLNKFAYIITAYQDEYQLCRLISALNKNADFFIHIDSRTDIQPFKKLLLPFSNVTFCANRYFVNWGSFAQVRSQMELLKCVVDTKTEYHKVICLSGTDYPLWSQKRLEEELSKDIEFICGYNITQSEVTKQMNKVNLYHFFRDIKVNHNQVKKMFSGSARTLMRMTPFRKGLHAVINSRKSDIYFGSDYWALSFPCAKYVLETMQREKEMMRYFKYSFGPSEMCVNTVVFNSDFSNKALPFPGKEYQGLASLTPLHYINYQQSIQILTETDYPTLLRSDKMFFRKAATGLSDTLLQKVDQFRES